MEPARILVAMGNDVSTNKLKSVLQESRFQVIGQAIEGNEVLRKMRSLKPDVTVLDYCLPPVNGFEIAKIALEDKLCDVILIMSNDQRNSINYTTRFEYGLVIVTKPLNRDSFISTIDLVIKNRKKVLRLEKEIEELRNTLDTRKEIERAKGLLMTHLKLSEEEAFRRIQKRSMDRGIPMKEIARAISIAYDI